MKTTRRPGRARRRADVGAHATAIGAPTNDPPPQSDETHGLTADLASRILKADDQNIARKAAAKKTLNAYERARLHEIMGGGASAPTPSGGRATSIVQLASALGISRMQLHRHLRAPGNPGRTPNGSYDIAGWRAWLAAKGARGGVGGDGDGAVDEMAVARLAVEQRRAIILDAQARQRLGELVPVDRAFAIIGRTFAAVRAVVEASPLRRADKIAIFHQLKEIPYEQFVAMARED